MGWHDGFVMVEHESGVQHEPWSHTWVEPQALVAQVSVSPEQGSL
jgi:hypothetical protein